MMSLHAVFTKIHRYTCAVIVTSVCAMSFFSRSHARIIFVRRWQTTVKNVRWHLVVVIPLDELCKHPHVVRHQLPARKLSPKRRSAVIPGSGRMVVTAAASLDTVSTCHLGGIWFIEKGRTCIECAQVPPSVGVRFRRILLNACNDLRGNTFWANIVL